MKSKIEVLFVYSWQNIFFIILSFLIASNANAQTKPKYKPVRVCRVLVFLEPDCPISQKYTKTLRELSQKYAKKNVQFVAIFPNKGTSEKSIDQFMMTYRLDFQYIQDLKQTLTKQYQAHITPEVFVVSSQQKILYSGAIDNWFFALGKHRPAPTSHYLSDAIEAYIHNKPMPIAYMQAVGCDIE